MLTSVDYFNLRDTLLRDPDGLISIEQQFTAQLLENVLLPACEDIYNDFYSRPKELIPFWRNYPPEQRGRHPIGNSVPWLELGEKTTASNLVRSLSNNFSDITFAGLPTGGDVRFTTGSFFVHLDIKLTGPNDNENEVVVPPNQISGDGKTWDDGVKNSSHPIRYLTGSRKGEINYHFQPKLPPFYVLGDQQLVCLTYFLETVYGYEGFGLHPLKHLELSCVPNGLLMFASHMYANNDGLLIAGKDDQTTPDSDKRIRVRLDPLSDIASWRSVKLKRVGETWESVPRSSKKM